MSILRRLPGCVLLLSVAATLAGCASSADGPRQPRENRGGFSVLVDGPGRPSAPQVVADIGSFARGHGFVRQPALGGPPVDPVTHETLPSAPERYLRGDIELDVSYQPTTHRVSAYLHSTGPRHDRGSIDAFYHEFDRAYAAHYGPDDPISESGYADDSGGPSVIDRPAGASVPGAGGGLEAPGGSQGAGGRL